MNDESFDRVPACGLKSGWELEARHIFVLSSSGKPIFSRYGDEQEMVTTFGLLQAVISIALDSGDSIKSITAGDRKIVYFIKQSLYFISMSSTNEPEVVLLKQLQFIYNQILMILTAKVHDVFRKNPSVDIRQLLGPDTSRLMHAVCQPLLTPAAIAFESVSSICCQRALRDEVLASLKHCVTETNAALGIVLLGDKLFCLSNNPNTELNLSTADILLLTHFVANSASLRSNDHNWVPICMPGFNPNGYLQAYISNLVVSGGTNTLQQQSNAMPVSESTTSNKSNDYDTSSFTLIFVAASADPTVFKELLRGKKYLEKFMQQSEIAPRLLHTVHHEQGVTVDRYLEPSRCLHFFFKYRPLLQPLGRRRKNKSNKSSSDSNCADINTAIQPEQLLPTQYIETSTNFPLNEPILNQSIWTQYQRLAVCIRRGTSTAEATLFPLPSTEATAGTLFPGASVSGGVAGASAGLRRFSSLSERQGTPTTHSSSSSSSTRSSTVGGNAGDIPYLFRNNSPIGMAAAAAAVSSQGISGNINKNHASRSGNGIGKEQGEGGRRDENAGDDPGDNNNQISLEKRSELTTDQAASLLSMLPASDHALSYVVLANGMVVVALASFDSELFATFPGTMSPLEASTMSDMLSRSLKQDAGNLFQISI